MFAQAEQVVEDEDFEATLALGSREISRRPELVDRRRGMTYLGIGPSQGSHLIDLMDHDRGSTECDGFSRCRLSFFMPTQEGKGLRNERKAPGGFDSDGEVAECGGSAVEKPGSGLRSAKREKDATAINGGRCHHLHREVRSGFLRHV
jgi:hypothetical protein